MSHIYKNPRNPFNVRTRIRSIYVTLRPLQGVLYIPDTFSTFYELCVILGYKFMPCI